MTLISSPGSKRDSKSLISRFPLLYVATKISLDVGTGAAVVFLVAFFVVVGLALGAFSVDLGATNATEDETVNDTPIPAEEMTPFPTPSPEETTPFSTLSPEPHGGGYEDADGDVGHVWVGDNDGNSCDNDGDQSYDEDNDRDNDGICDEG